jgi:hypothetical protein
MRSESIKDNVDVGREIFSGQWKLVSAARHRLRLLGDMQSIQLHASATLCHHAQPRIHGHPCETYRSVRRESVKILRYHRTLQAASAHQRLQRAQSPAVRDGL